jgi:hypothetical protein
MAQAGDAASRRGVVPAPYRALMADNDAPGQPVPGSWQETLQSFSTEAGENTDADRGLKLAFWAMIICLVGAPVALVGLFYSARGLVRSGRLGGRKAAVAGIVANLVALAVPVVILVLA